MNAEDGQQHQAARTPSYPFSASQITRDPAPHTMQRISSQPEAPFFQQQQQQQGATSAGHQHHSWFVHQNQLFSTATSVAGSPMAQQPAASVAAAIRASGRHGRMRAHFLSDSEDSEDSEDFDEGHVHQQGSSTSSGLSSPTSSHTSSTSSSHHTPFLSTPTTSTPRFSTVYAPTPQLPSPPNQPHVPGDWKGAGTAGDGSIQVSTTQSQPATQNQPSQGPFFSSREAQAVKDTFSFASVGPAAAEEGGEQPEPLMWSSSVGGVGTTGSAAPASPGAVSGHQASTGSSWVAGGMHGRISFGHGLPLHDGAHADSSGRHGMADVPACQPGSSGGVHNVVGAHAPSYLSPAIPRPSFLDSTTPTSSKQPLLPASSPSPEQGRLAADTSSHTAHSTEPDSTSAAAGRYARPTCSSSAAAGDTLGPTPLQGSPVLHDSPEDTTSVSSVRWHGLQAHEQEGELVFDGPLNFGSSVSATPDSTGSNAVYVARAPDAGEQTRAGMANGAVAADRQTAPPLLMLLPVTNRAVPVPASAMSGESHGSRIPRYRDSELQGSVEALPVGSGGSNQAGSSVAGMPPVALPPEAEEEDYLQPMDLSFHFDQESDMLTSRALQPEAAFTTQAHGAGSDQDHAHDIAAGVHEGGEGEAWPQAAPAAGVDVPLQKGPSTSSVLLMPGDGTSNQSSGGDATDVPLPPLPMAFSPYPTGRPPLAR